MRRRTVDVGDGDEFGHGDDEQAVAGRVDVEQLEDVQAALKVGLS